MSSRAELEAALAASWSRELLAVYGDYLQSIGDPRGELIAIDLHVADHGPSAELAARKISLAGTWLGPEVAVAVEIDHGFLAVRDRGNDPSRGVLRKLLALPVGRYLKRCAIEGTPEWREQLRPALDAAVLPFLDDLDVSAEIGRRVSDRTSIYEWVGALAIARQLRRLRVPSLRSDDEVDALERAIVGLRPDAEIVVARAYTRYPTRAPSPRIRVPPPRPWPPPDSVHGRSALTIDVPGDPFGEDVGVADAADLMNEQFERLPEPARAAWVELWRLLDDLPHDDGETMVAFSGDALARALEPLDLEARPRWRDLRTALHNRSGAAVTIRRYWGW
jgi:hypothetical protein